MTNLQARVAKLNEAIADAKKNYATPYDSIIDMPELYTLMCHASEQTNEAMALLREAGEALCEARDAVDNGWKSQCYCFDGLRCKSCVSMESSGQALTKLRNAGVIV